MKKQHERMLEAFSGIDDKVIEKNSQKRFLLWTRWKARQRRKRNLFISIGSAAACLCILFPMILLLLRPDPTTGGGQKPPVTPPPVDGQVPIYTGMTMSNEYVATASLPAYGLPASMARGNGNGNNGNHFGNDKKPIGDAAADALGVTPSAQDKYYTTPNSDIYITVHFDNPDEFEILSFRLNGVKYAVQQFLPGSDLENLIIKLNVGDVEGMVSYTITEIKYVDGESITERDVEMRGEDTIKVYVSYRTQPAASVSGETVGLDSVSFGVTITDPNALVAAVEGEMWAMLYDGESILQKKQLSLGDNSVTFEGLTTDRLYQYAVVALYDSYDGNGKSLHVLLSRFVYPESDYSIVFRDGSTFDENGDSITAEIVGVNLRDWKGSEPLEIVFPSVTPDGRDVIAVYLHQFFLFPTMIRGEQFEANIKAPLEALIDAGTISELDYNKVLNLFTCYDLSSMEEYVKDSYFERYPFMRYIDDTWYSLRTNIGEEDLNILLQIGFDADAAAEEIQTALMNVGAIDVWQATKYLFCTVDASREIRFVLPETAASVSIPECIKPFVSEVEGGVFYCGTTVIGCEDSATDITLREGTRVIPMSCFAGKTNLVSVTIPEGVEAIEWSAFENCTSLAYVSLPESLWCIMNHAFSGCTSLTQINIPDGVTYVGRGAFDDCPLTYELEGGVLYLGPIALGYESGVTEVVFREGTTIIPSINGLYTVTLPASLKVLPSFLNNGRIERVVLSEGLLEIPRDMFGGCRNLTTVVLPNGLLSIGAYAFMNCTSLTDINIPDSVTSIGSSAFSGCSSLTSITIPDSVKNIRQNAFFGCTGLIEQENGVSYVDKWAISVDKTLTEVTLRADTVGIARMCFNQSAVVSVDLPDGLRYLANVAFYKCESLTELTIPASVEYIDGNTFLNCNIQINVEAGNTTYHVANGFLIETATKTVLWGIDPRDLPDDGSVVAIREAFQNLSDVTEVVLPDSIVRVEGYAFTNAKNLVKITLPKGLEYIGSFAFAYCTALTDIYFGGTMAEWEAVEKYTEAPEEWNQRCSEITVHCTDGDVIIPVV